MKKVLSILVLYFLFSGSASTEQLESFQNINELLEKGYSLHSTNVIDSDRYQYNLISNGSGGNHRLITCVYTIEQNVAICWVP